MSQTDSKAATPASVVQPPSGVLPPQLVRFLSGGQTCIVATVDDEGSPSTTLMTWVVARDPVTLTLAVDQRSRALRNLRKRPHVAIEVLGDGICYGLRGHADIEKETLAAAPFPSALVTVRIEECRDHAAPGVRFYGPRYDFEPGKEHRGGVEQAVFEELRGVAPPV
jgi:predicted pyridoxine 5'-phosphate oxidase superfamily flavin-nucleotide-binding protein